MLRKTPVFTEMRGTADNRFITGDAVECLEKLKGQYAGQVALTYMDPPFLTGKSFEARVRVGEKDWEKGLGTLVLDAYSDKLDKAEYLAYMKQTLLNIKLLMKPNGLVFVHIDWRMDAYMRLIMDEVFGERNFLNEIIWTYESGGRAKNFFSRKHDVILMYALSSEYDLHTADVAVPRQTVRSNHMKRELDEDGRAFRTIRSAGKVYRYYDDEPVVPSDVWSDIGFLQQKDPQRTGYDTQKPMALLERIVKCAAHRGDLVLDPFAGSCTTLEAAERHGCRFIGIDSNPLVASYVRRRTSNCMLTLAQTDALPHCEIEILPLLASHDVILKEFALEKNACDRQFKGLDAVDSWAVGHIENGVFYVLAESIRSIKSPKIDKILNLPLVSGECAVRITDVLGRDHYYTTEAVDE